MLPEDIIEASVIIISHAYEQDNLALSSMAQYISNKPSNKKQGKD